MHHKIHNQTLFVAALSVYLGLLIVGAPPQVVAQQSKFMSALRDGSNIDFEPRMTLAEIRKAEETIKQSRNLTVAFYAKLNEFADREHFGAVPTHFVKKTVFSGDLAIESQIVTAEGNPAILDFLRRESVRAASESQPAAFLKSDLNLNSVVTNIKISQSEIISKSILTFVSESAAQKLSAGTLQAMLAEAQRQELRRAQQNRLENKEVVLDPFVMGLRINRINNQIIIITHLPRAGLHAFLKANEKAN